MCVANCSSSLNSLVSWLTMSAMTWVSSTATNFSVFFATGLVVAGSESVPNNFCQKLRTCFASETISSTVFLTSTKDVLASLYSLQPCLIAATQALAAKRILIGSISYLRYAVRSHMYTTMYGCKFASVTLTPVVEFATVIPVVTVLTNRVAPVFMLDGFQSNPLPAPVNC